MYTGADSAGVCVCVRACVRVLMRQECILKAALFDPLMSQVLCLFLI